MSTSSSQGDPSTLRGHALAVALLAAGALFMENLDATIIATGLPTMARDFHTGAVAVNVGITAYLLTLAVFIPLSGWTATRFGERRVFASAILVFTIASVLCAASHTLPLFTASRVLQGIGGSMMVPVGRLMVLRASTKAQLMKAIAYTIWPALVAPMLGPLVGGWILSFATWPWMFLLNVPIGLLLFLLTLKVVRPEPGRAAESFDVRGFVLAGGASFLLVYLLERLQSPHTSVYVLSLLLTAGGALLWSAIRHLRTASQPLFDLHVLRIQTFWVSVLPGSLFRMAVFSVPFLLPLLFQEAFGLSALASGSLTMAVFAGNLAMKPLTAPFLRRYGFRRVLVVNGSLTVVLLAACGWLRPTTPHLLTLLVLFLGGLGRSLELTALTTMSFSELPDSLKDSGATLSATMQQMTTSFGIAIAALTLHLSASFHHRSSASDFRVAFCAMALLAACAIPAFVGLQHNAGAAVRGIVQREREIAPVEG